MRQTDGKSLSYVSDKWSWANLQKNLARQCPFHVSTYIPRVMIGCQLHNLRKYKDSFPKSTEFLKLKKEKFLPKKI